VKPTYHARLDRAIQTAYGRYRQAAKYAEPLRLHRDGILPPDSWEARRLDETYRLWWGLLDLHDRSGFWVYPDCITFGGEDA